MKETKRKYFVIAPHNDDFLIGCYRILDQIQMVVMCDEERNKEKSKEFTAACDILKIPSCKLIYARDDKIRTQEIVNIIEIWMRNKKLELVLPSPFDFHPLHKTCSALGLGHQPLTYYSIDMNVPWVERLTDEEREHKKSLLDQLFPLEKELWKYDNSYYLFESHWKVF